MTVEIHPVGLKCNLVCSYCYEEGLRSKADPPLQLEKIFKRLDEFKSEFTVFGGEPLLTPVSVLEKIFQYGYERYKKSGVQTNGTILTHNHIELFKKYNVHVGVSCDGPGDLSKCRTSRSGSAYTKVTTTMTTKNIEALLANGIGTSLIVTLHADNVRGNNLGLLVEWLRDLASKGLRSARLHLMELDNPDKSSRLLLTPEEEANAILVLSQIEGIEFDFLSDMRKALLNENTSCTWSGCDPYTTSAVVGIDADGSLSNCYRTSKNGVNYRKSSSPGRERIHSLYRTPYDQGGCKGCRFFAACKGHCPGTGIDGDWRNRTSHCRTLLILFQKVEQDLLLEGKKPISLWTDREVGKRSVEHGDQHGDMYFAPVGRPE